MPTSLCKRKITMKIYELDEYPLSDRNGTYGGNSGDKESIMINGEYWLVKYPKKASKLHDVKEMSYTSTPESEYLGSHVYEILGFPVHKTILGIRNDSTVVACKDLCDENHRLIEFRQLKNTYNKILNEKLDTSLSSTGSDHFVCLDEILVHLDYNPSLKDIPGIKERFWDCVIIDGLINNNDRNNGNWGILRGPDGDSLAPIFDNGASFSPNVAESKITNKLYNHEVLRQSALNGITAYSLNGENNALFRDLIKIDNPELKKAIIRNVPLIKNNMQKISDMIDEIPGKYREKSLMSEDRKAEYKKEISIRIDEILLPAYEKILEKEQEKTRRNLSRNQRLNESISLGD